MADMQGAEEMEDESYEALMELGESMGDASNGLSRTEMLKLKVRCASVYPASSLPYSARPTPTPILTWLYYLAIPSHGLENHPPHSMRLPNPFLLDPTTRPTARPRPILFHVTPFRLAHPSQSNPALPRPAASHPIPPPRCAPLRRTRRKSSAVLFVVASSCRATVFSHSIVDTTTTPSALAPGCAPSVSAQCASSLSCSQGGDSSYLTAFEMRWSRLARAT